MAADPPDQPLDRELVRLGYYFVLNREPESEAVVEEKLTSAATLRALRDVLRNSDEFRVQMQMDRYLPRMIDGYWSPPQPVEYQVSPDLMARLVARIRAQWTRLGQEDPYWSVLTHEGFRLNAMTDAALASFRETGRESASLVDLVSRRAGRPTPTGTCVELGCGVGRVTRHLADRFEKVIAVDISPGNLALCERYMRDENVRNVETVLLSDIHDLHALPAYDFLYSVIVLQHNPPPIQFAMLSTLLAKIRPGGACVFQTVADMPNYAFKAEDYLRTDSPAMEVHCLPMAAILKLVHDTGLVLDGARMDSWIEVYGSYTFSASRS
jgi:2-polyprenyl-3-methyl-5-hydroxy-6-metoxy-1,4-benzoquinol methylase